MRYFTTRCHFKPVVGHKITWLYGHKPTPKGPVEIKIGCCFHRWKTRTTHWFVWGAKHTDNKWLRGEYEKLHAS